MVTTATRIDLSESEALTRLLAKARAEGVKLLRDNDGRHFATSATTPGKRYLVTGFSCECRGFVAHQRCKHLAALLSALGWLKDEPEPESTPPAVSVSPCGECGGHGEIQDLEVRQHGRFVMQWTNCPDCHGSGIPADTDVREAA